MDFAPAFGGDQQPSPTLTPKRGRSPEPLEKSKKRPSLAPNDKYANFSVILVIRMHKDRASFRVPISVPLEKSLCPVLPNVFKNIEDIEKIELLIRESHNHYRKIDCGLPPKKLGWSAGDEIHLALALPKKKN
jgi:hypothetical protein